MTTKYEQPQYRNGVFFDELRESAPTGARKQVYLLNGQIVGIGEMTECHDREDTFFDGGITHSVRGGKTKEIKGHIAKNKDLRTLAEGAPIHKTGVPSGNATIEVTDLLNMEQVFINFKGFVPLTNEDRVEMHIRLAQASRFLEKDHKELSEWLKYVSRNAIAQIR